MAITLADFNKIWASTSPLTPYSFSESNYKQGWNFIGSTPPARQMWDFLQKQNDEKMQYIVNDICVPTEIDETSASGDYYSYPVPTGKVFANFKTLGGKTVAFNQLVQNGNFANTSVWETYNCTFSVSSNVGTMGVNATNQYVYLDQPATYVNAHTFYIAGDIENGLSSNTATLTMYAVDTTVDSVNASVSAGSSGRCRRIIHGSTENATKKIRVFCGSGAITDTGTVKVKNFICVDLTLMFGAGNEPSTVAEFEAMFPASYYAYNEGALVSAGIKEVIAKDSSNNVVATMPIPSAVQALDGYGWSARTAYNYIDFERKVFVKKVTSVNMSILDWTFTPSGNSGWFSAQLPSMRTNGFSDFTVNNVLCAQYLTTSFDSMSSFGNDKVMSARSNGFIQVHDTTMPDVATFKTAMSGVMLYYELATPVEIDISSILGAVGIACGNTLTFNYDMNYRLLVPVSMDLLDGTNGLITPQDKAKLDVAYGATQADWTNLPIVTGDISMSPYGTSSAKVSFTKKGNVCMATFGNLSNLPSGASYSLTATVPEKFRPVASVHTVYPVSDGSRQIFVEIQTNGVVRFWLYGSAITSETAFYETLTYVC